MFKLQKKKKNKKRILLMLETQICKFSPYTIYHNSKQQNDEDGSLNTANYYRKNAFDSSSCYEK